MQLSHDEKVFLASSKGFWRANSAVASNDGIAMPGGVTAKSQFTRRRRRQEDVFRPAGIK